MDRHATIMSGKKENANIDENVSPPKQFKTDVLSASATTSRSNKDVLKDDYSDTSKPSTSKIKNIAPLNTLLVSTKQKGNPLLKFLTNVHWEYSDIVPDYVMGKTMCALFLSIRYHQLNPDYIHNRLKALGNAYTLRVLLVQVDVADPHHSLKHLTRICILADLTLILAWNAEEAGKIIETYKMYENKPPDRIMGLSESAPHQKLINALTTVRSVNKTDATTLLSSFGSMENIIRATPEDLCVCPGLGFQKAQRLHKVLHESFLRTQKSGKLK